MISQDRNVLTQVDFLCMFLTVTLQSKKLFLIYFCNILLILLTFHVIKADCGLCLHEKEQIQKLSTCHNACCEEKTVTAKVTVENCGCYCHSSDSKFWLWHFTYYNKLKQVEDKLPLLQLPQENVWYANYLQHNAIQYYLSILSNKDNENFCQYQRQQLQFSYRQQYLF